MATRATRIKIYLEDELITSPCEITWSNDRRRKSELRIEPNPRPIRVWVMAYYENKTLRRKQRVRGKSVRVYSHLYGLVYRCYRKKPK